MTDDLRRLSSWLRDAGGHHDGVEIQELRGMRGAVATRPFAAGSEIAAVPAGLSISVKTALGRLADREMQATALEESSESTQLAVWLLVEHRDPRSAFRPYLDLLPHSFPDFAIHAAPADLALLDGSWTGSMLDVLRANLESAYARLEIDVPWFRSVGFDEFVWAKTCVQSRGFAFMLHGEQTKVLLPFGDMLNHAPRPNTRWRYDADGRVFRLFARCECAAGEEVCGSYGRKPNRVMLLNYGFCIDDNDADDAVLGSTEKFRVVREPTAPSGQHMLARLRARCRDEAAARAALADAARAGIARFSTTIAKDRALLAAGELSTAARNFVLARLGEKRVLNAWLAFATEGPAEAFRP